MKRERRDYGHGEFSTYRCNERVWHRAYYDDDISFADIAYINGFCDANNYRRYWHTSHLKADIEAYTSRDSSKFASHSWGKTTTIESYEEWMNKPCVTKFMKSQQYKDFLDAFRKYVRSRKA